MVITPRRIATQLKFDQKPGRDLTDNRGMRRYMFPILALVAVGGGLLLASYLWPVERVTVWADRATGTTKTTTEYAFHEEETVYHHSPLEARLRRMDSSFTYDWVPGSRVTRNLWGQERWEYGKPQCPSADSCSVADIPAHHLNSDNLAVYAEVATDDEIKRFVHTARQGTMEEQIVAVQRATHVWIMDMHRTGRMLSPTDDYKQRLAVFEAEHGPIAEAMRP